jgi:hypothetical protein
LIRPGKDDPAAAIVKIAASFYRFQRQVSTFGKLQTAGILRGCSWGKPVVAQMESSVFSTPV